MYGTIKLYPPNKLRVVPDNNIIGFDGKYPLIYYALDKCKISQSASWYIENIGTGGSVYDASMYGSDAVYLNGVDQYVELPITHNIGINELGTPSAYGSNTLLDNGDGTFTLNVVDDSAGAYIIINGVINKGNLFKFELVNSSVPISDELCIINAEKTFNILDQPIKYEFIMNRATAYNFYFSNLKIGESYTFSVSLQEITIPTNSYMTYFNVDVKAFEQHDNTTIPAISTYKMDKSFQLYFTHDTPLSQADLDALNSNPNLLFDVWFNGASLPSGFNLSNIVDFIPANDRNSGQFVQNLRYDKNSLITDCGTQINPYLNAVYIAPCTYRLIDADRYSGAITTDYFPPNKFYYLEFTIKNMVGVADVRAGIIGGNNITVTNDGTYIAKLIQYTSINRQIKVEYNYVDLATFDITDIKIYNEADFIAYEIQNYTTACRDTYHNIDFGATNFLLQQDASGRPIGIMPTVQIAGSDDGRYIEVPPSMTQYPITVCTAEISGDSDTSLTITQC